MRKYELEYEFIPLCVSLFEDGNISSDELADFNTNFIDDDIVDGLSISSERQADGTLIIMFTFPEPERESFAKYGLIVIKDEKKAFYVTLEMGRDCWFVCSTKASSHFNYGHLEGSPDWETFKKTVLKMIDEQIIK